MTRLLVIAALGLAAFAAVTLAQTPAPEPPATDRGGDMPGVVTRPVSRDKFVKAVAGWRAARDRVRSLERTLRHEPSVAEALSVASIAYGVPRGELSSVAWCESTHRAHARNGQYRGIFQQGPMFEATPYGRAGLSVWSPYAAALSTAYVVAQQGWRQWECKP